MCGTSSLPSPDACRFQWRALSLLLNCRFFRFLFRSLKQWNSQNLKPNSQTGFNGDVDEGKLHLLKRANPEMLLWAAAGLGVGKVGTSLHANDGQFIGKSWKKKSRRRKNCKTASTFELGFGCGEDRWSEGRNRETLKTIRKMHVLKVMKEKWSSGTGWV